MRTFRLPLFFLLLSLFAGSLYPQNGLHLLKHYDNKHGTTSGVSYSGSWGYVGPDGREYAIVGTATGTAIIEITDTANVHEIAHVGGPTSVWREMRTYKNYLYIVSEGGSGTQIVDLSPLPAGVNLIKNYVYTSGALNTIRAHTIEIFDGYMYLNGCANWAPGGVLIFSLADPLNPQLVGEYDPPGTGSQRYVHDCYVRNDTIYAASIYTNGGLNIASVADKTSPQHIAKIAYAGSGTHNAWTTTDGQYAITTDEIGSTVKSLKFWNLSSLPTPPAAPTATYQITPSDIEHNVFVRGKYAYTAWYTAGIAVVDVRNPASPATAGFYDTSNDTLYPPGNYDGVWAVYPYFWSNKVTAGDMQNGLYIFAFDSLRARTPVSLVQPANLATVCAGGAMTFRWTRPADLTQDPTRFWLHIFGSGYDSTYKLGSDTSFTLANPQVLGGGTFSWHVYTVDDANTVSSQDTFTFVRPVPAVSTPNGGEQVKILSQIAISWAWGCPDSVEISLSTNNGSSWAPLAMAAGSPYMWNVPMQPTTQALIRVRDIHDTTRADVSDSAFTLFNSAAVSVTSPDGGEVWQGGTQHTITWSSVAIDSIKIEYSTNNGAAWSVVVADTPASLGSYDWMVPNILTSQGLIRITDLFNNSVVDQSDAPFLVALMTNHMSAGWNLASIPVDPAYSSASANFAFAVSPAFAYSGSYTEEDSVTNGPGYWVRYDSARTIGALGSLISTDSIPVARNWNMIGSVSFPVAVTSITSEPDSMTVTNFFGYSADSGYTITDSLRPGRGYWVKTSVPGMLIISSSSAVPGNRVRIVPTNELPPAPPPSVRPAEPAQLPDGFALEQNFPNPFNPETVLKYRLRDAGFVTLKIYDVLGREMSTLVNEEKQPGYYAVRWNSRQGTTEAPSGLYYARLTVSDAAGKQSYQSTIKLVLMK